MRKFLVVAVALSLMTMLAPPAAAAPYCGIEWGSLKRTSDRHPDAEVVTVRSGEHRCFDRLVVELDGKAPGYEVKYVKRFVPSPDGKVVRLRGDATLQITMLGVRAHDEDGNPTYAPAKRSEMLPVRDYRTFRQAYWGGTFEGTTVIGLGVRARLPFRVFTLKGPGDHRRLVVDVAHKW